MADLEQQNQRLDQQRARALEGAQTSRLRSMSSLAAGVAHEVNSPLGSLQASADVIERALDKLLARLERGGPVQVDDPVVRRSLRALQQAQPLVRESSSRIGQVVKQLETFSHLDRARHAPVDLPGAVETALSLLSVHMGDRIEVVRRYDEVPPVTGDGDQLHLLLMNLLCNAQQAIEGAGRVTVSVTRQGQQVVVRVQDTGQGIADENLPRIFEPGFTTRTGGVGTGLGLPISQRIVTAHGGQLDVACGPGGGTQITVRLPI